MSWFRRHYFEWQLYPSFHLSYHEGPEDNRWLIIGPIQMRWRA